MEPVQSYSCVQRSLARCLDESKQGVRSKLSSSITSGRPELQPKNVQCGSTSAACRIVLPLARANEKDAARAVLISLTLVVVSTWFLQVGLCSAEKPAAKG